MIIAQKLWSNAVKFNSKHFHFRKKEGKKLLKSKPFSSRRDNPDNLGHSQSAAGFERAEVLGTDTTRYRAHLHPTKINRR